MDHRQRVVLGQLIDTIVHPDPGTDQDLGDVLTKIKGKWKWATLEGVADMNFVALPEA